MTLSTVDLAELINLTITRACKLHMSNYTDAVKLQKRLALRVITKDCLKSVRNVCAVDVSYRDRWANASAVVIDAKTLDTIEHVTSVTKIEAPYVPGLMMLRESGPIMSALKLLHNNFDVLLVDGNGQLHPRKCGLGCYIGIILDRPTIGVAKSLLCGKIRKNSVEFDGKILARIIEKKKGKRIFVSVGNKISLKTATKLVDSLIKDCQWLPEPIRLADRYSKDWSHARQI
jgi:deoxyribonuclease V